MMVKVLSIVKEVKKALGGQGRKTSLLEEESKKALWKRELLNRSSRNRGVSCRLTGKSNIPYYPV